MSLENVGKLEKKIIDTGEPELHFETRQNLTLKEISGASPRIFTNVTARQTWHWTVLSL